MRSVHHPFKVFLASRMYGDFGHQLQEVDGSIVIRRIYWGGKVIKQKAHICATGKFELPEIAPYSLWGPFRGLPLRHRVRQEVYLSDGTGEDLIMVMVKNDLLARSEFNDRDMYLSFDLQQQMSHNLPYLDPLFYRGAKIERLPPQ